MPLKSVVEELLLAINWIGYVLYILEMGKITYNFVKNQLCLIYWWCNDGLSKQRMYF